MVIMFYLRKPFLIINVLLFHCTSTLADQVYKLLCPSVYMCVHIPCNSFPGISLTTRSHDQIQGLSFWAARSSSRSQVVCRSVAWSVGPTPLCGTWVSEWLSEWVSEWVSQWRSDWVTGWLSDWVTKLKSNCDKTQKLKLCTNWDKTKKFKLRQNSTQIVTKLKKSNCDKTQILNILQNSKTVTATKKLKMWQNSNVTKFRMCQNSKTQILTKL